ncbi:PepSY domain-containing protein [Nocardiopsis mangrovi]|uniref:PepSY domain-containing protein n=1 Tax=Nocardiopsis mangrovi TaxID=1179818 RepID=A0ABV9DWF7_9ACTN
MRGRTTIVLSSVAGLAALGTGAYLLADDPEHAIEPIRVSGVTAGEAPGGGPADQTASTQPVAGLEQLEGVLSAGDDVDDWYVSGVEVDFGPEEWLLTDPAVPGLDGEGASAPVLDVLRGLEGGEVTLGVRYEDDDDGDRDDADVYTVNGASYRDHEGGPAPWQDTGDRPEADRDAVAAAAEAAVGDGARAGEVERTREDGWEGWDVEVHGADGREYEVLLDATGEVVDTRADD